MSKAGLIFHVKSHHANEKNQEIIDKSLDVKDIKDQEKEDNEQHVAKSKFKKISSENRLKTSKKIESKSSNYSKGHKTKSKKSKPKLNNVKTKAKESDLKNSPKQEVTSRTRNKKK